MLVRSLGYATATFASAEEFLQSGRLSDTACLITDVQMPGMSGVELCRRVRNEGASRDACVIAVTGRTDLKDKDLEPFDGFLHKPISPAALEHALKFSEG